MNPHHLIETPSNKTLWQTIAKNKSTKYLEEKFDPVYAIGFKNFLREKTIFELLQLKPIDTFLDVGCASGRHVFHAADICKKGVGIDIAPQFIETAITFAKNNNINNTEFLTGSIERLPFSDHSFDVVLCAEVIEHLPDPAIALKELARVLKPYGRLIISVPNENGDGTYWKRIKNTILRKKFRPITKFTLEEVERHGHAHVRSFNSKTIQTFLKSNHFEPYQVRGVSMLDAPFFDLIINRVNKIKYIRSFFIVTETFLSRKTWLSQWGRQLVVAAKKVNQML